MIVCVKFSMQPFFKHQHTLTVTGFLYKSKLFCFCLWVFHFLYSLPLSFKRNQHTPPYPPLVPPPYLNFPLISHGNDGGYVTKNQQLFHQNTVRSIYTVQTPLRIFCFPCRGPEKMVCRQMSPEGLTRGLNEEFEFQWEFCGFFQIRAFSDGKMVWEPGGGALYQ